MRFSVTDPFRTSLLFGLQNEKFLREAKSSIWKIFGVLGLRSWFLQGIAVGLHRHRPRLFEQEGEQRKEVYRAFLGLSQRSHKSRISKYQNLSPDESIKGIPT